MSAWPSWVEPGALIAIAGALGLAALTAVAAAEEPTGFSGLPWGSSAAKVREALKTRCQFAEPVDAFKQQCPGYQIADIPGKLTLLFVPGYGLSGWDFSCSADRATGLVQQITERFGEASQEGSTRAIWHWKWGSAALYKNECSVSVATDRALEFMRQVEQERAKRQKKDF